jgi:hypothetical protein
MITNIIQKMVDDTHYYWVEGNFYPSVSHILDMAAPKEYGLINFFKQNTPEEIEDISGKAKENGSLVHDACEKLLNGIEIPLKDYSIKAKKALVSFYEWYNAFKPTSLITEQMVASNIYKYAGTLDLVCTIGDKRILIDFKTNKGSIYFTNKLQVMAYKQAYEETTEEKIDECWILRLGSQHKCGYEYKLIDDVSIKDFQSVFNIYLTMNGGKIEEPPIIDVYPDTLKLCL